MKWESKRVAILIRNFALPPAATLSGPYLNYIVLQ
jgi:hypothetical protein